jgi:Tol biopolymer transport system component
MWICLLMVAAAVIAVGGAADASVSGENGKIAFVTDRDGNDEIYLMEADGGNPINLTNNPARDRDPAWSPDGRQIAFTTDRDGNNEIYVMDADGGNPINLTNNPGSDTDPAWSPNGRSIAFASGAGIFVIETSGEGRTRLTRADPGEIEWALGASDGSATWSPDGERIAFVRTFDGPTPAAMTAPVYTVAADGSGVPVHFADGGWNNAGIDWAPDGAYLAVGRVSSHDKWSSVALISESGETGLPNPGGWTHAADPAVSPDGARIAVAAANINRVSSEIMVMDIDGANPINLTDHPAWDHQPAWQPLNPIPIGLVDPASGQWHLRDVAGLVTSHYFGTSGDHPFLGDWDCDGIATSGVYRASDATVYLRNSNTTGVADHWFHLDAAGAVPLSGDWNGDGCDTIAVFWRGLVLVDEVLPPVGGEFEEDRSYWFGLGSDAPFSGDFNGDGKDTIGLHREASGIVYLNDVAPIGSIATTDQLFWYGIAGDVVFSGDWVGLGTDTVASFRPDWGKFFFRFANTTGPADREFFLGEPDWLVVGGPFSPEPGG